MLRSIGPALISLGLMALPAMAEDVSSFTLDNGMEVVVIEDHRAPVVVNMVWYRIGAADEPAGKSGIAHFLEHLMFKGTDTLDPGEFSDTVEQNGGSDNAFTSYDYTGYFQRVAADRLDLMMQMEADRMTHLVLTDDVVLPERDVILEERNQRIENDPGALFNEQRMAAQYMNHPYGIPIIGWRHEMAGLTKEDAIAFYRQYYAPNNAVLVVAGDVEPEAVRALAEEHFGTIPPNPDLRVRQRPSEPPQLAARRVIYEDARVAQPYVLRSYLAPSRHTGGQKQAAALTILAQLMGGSAQTSLMGRTLEVQEKTALYTGAFYNPTALDDTTFALLVMPVPGRSLDDAEVDMDRMIAEFLKNGVDAEQLARLKMQLKADEIYSRDKLQGLAQDYGEALTSGLTVAEIQAWPEVLQAVTPEDVMQAAELLTDKRTSVTGIIRRPDAEVEVDAAAQPANPTEEVIQ
ncbi:pitrilysin family protein [Tropicimonas sp. IMCC34043]|uniref:M16 family metallopeptidase n=1 Tax=Tropicimonas sp. IMCC34043 TaxID=2248760 RepID=UPI000E274922|nr:pitrilysin family protein [Tropicimonas sp. IMCC34043]